MELVLCVSISAFRSVGERGIFLESRVSVYRVFFCVYEVVTHSYPPCRQSPLKGSYDMPEGDKMYSFVRNVAVLTRILVERGATIPPRLVCMHSVVYPSVEQRVSRCVLVMIPFMFQAFHVCT